MQTFPAPAKNAATFRKKVARRIEIKIKKEVLKKMAALESKGRLYKPSALS